MLTCWPASVLKSRIWARSSSITPKAGLLVVYYPEGWSAEDSGYGELALASSPALLDGTMSGGFTGLAAGEAVGGVQRLRVEQYTGWGLTVDASPTEVIAGLITTADERDELFLGKVEVFDAHGVPAGIAVGRINLEGGYYGIIITNHCYFLIIITFLDS